MCQSVSIMSVLDMGLKLFLRRKVSLKKNRVKLDGCAELDMSVIGDRIIAIGFPAVGFTSLYRNSRQDVKKMLSTHFPKHAIFNLCKEPAFQYKPSVAFPNIPVHFIGFKDHFPPELEQFVEFCSRATDFLLADPENIAVVHCKAGKGRTGTMICALLYTFGVCDSAVESFLSYGKQRSKNEKGVTIVSQRRFVHYFLRLCAPYRADGARITVFNEIKVNKPEVRVIAVGVLRCSKFASKMKGSKVSIKTVFGENVGKGKMKIRNGDAIGMLNDMVSGGVFIHMHKCYVSFHTHFSHEDGEPVCTPQGRVIVLHYVREEIDKIFGKTKLPNNLTVCVVVGGSIDADWTMEMSHEAMLKCCEQVENRSNYQKRCDSPFLLSHPEDDPTAVNVSTGSAEPAEGNGNGDGTGE